MALNVNIQLNVPALTDGEIWFADATSWTNYWRGLNLAATFNAATNDVYTDAPFNTLLPYIDVASGVGSVASQAQLTSLLADYNALKTAFKEMRTVMKAAGYLTQAQ